jgi:DNA-binding IclR family transcriptional regulator
MRSLTEIPVPPKLSEPGPNGTVKRVVQLLRALVDTDAASTITALADQLQLPRSTVHRLLGLLREEGLVVTDPDTKRYDVGPEFLRIAGRIAGRTTLLEIARPIMERVVEETGEKCVLSLHLPEQRKMMLAAEVRSASPLTYETTLFRPMSLVWSVAGRAILAWLPEDEIVATVESDPTSPSGERAVLTDTVRGLAEIREKGFAELRAFTLEGAHGVAAPIFGPGRVPVGSLVIVVPAVRTSDRTAEIGPLLVQHAAEVSRRIGG